MAPRSPWFKDPAGKYFLSIYRKDKHLLKYDYDKGLGKYKELFNSLDETWVELVR